MSCLCEYINTSSSSPLLDYILFCYVLFCFVLFCYVLFGSTYSEHVELVLVQANGWKEVGDGSHDTVPIEHQDSTPLGTKIRRKKEKGEEKRGKVPWQRCPVF